jgi:CheY-like chemotaxis protein
MSAVPVQTNPRPRLLVVDDDDAIRETIQALFAGLDYDVATAKNGAEALEQIRHRHADVVLTDIFMEGSDGFELISTLRNGHRQTMVVAMSGGHAAFSPLAFANKLGADLVISKPFRAGQLVEAIDRLVRGFHRLPQ